MFEKGNRVVTVGGMMMLRGKRGTVVGAPPGSKVAVELDARYGLKNYSVRYYDESDLRLLTPEEIETEKAEQEELSAKKEEEISPKLVLCSAYGCTNDPTTKLHMRLSQAISFDIFVCEDCYAVLHGIYVDGMTIEIDQPSEKI